MKQLTNKLLHLALALATVCVLLTTALAAETDTLTLTAYPEGGPITVSTSEETFFYVIPALTDIDGADVTEDYSFSFLWLLDNTIVSTSNYFEFPSDISAASYTLTCSVTAAHLRDNTTKTAQITWYPTVKHTKDISLTINQDLGNFYFTSTETQTATSVFDELCDILVLQGNAALSSYSISFFPDKSNIATLNGNVFCGLTELSDTYLSISDHGTWTTQYSVTLDSTEIVSGKLSIVIEPHIGMDTFYTAAPGENVTISALDFSRFWIASTNSSATLDYVRITSCTGMSGVLCYNHSANEKGHSSAYGLVMYPTPTTSAQKALADLTFIPAKSSNKYSSDTVTIKFTASGTDRNRNPITVSGSIVILYNDKEATSISYDCTSTHVMLSTSDFTEVYRAVTGSNAKNPSYTIRFLDVPAYGTLYRGYSSDFYGTLTSTALTEDNLSTLTFSSLSTDSNSLDRLAYVPSIYTSDGDTVRYIAYSGAKVLYVGTVSFTSEEFVVTYTTASSPVSFSSTDFYTPGSPLLYAQYIVFNNPSSGTLYKDYADGTGTRVRSGDYFSYQTAFGVNLLDNVTYVPKENFTGTVDIPFYAYSLSGGSVSSGKVRIYVVGNAFADVDPNDWAAPYINRLYASGIISGTSATTFSPDKNMTYGAALKMILVAAGYPKQSETGGSHWASNYLNLAYKKGIVSFTDLDLDAAVDRTTIAELAAKALGLEKASSVNAGLIAPSDSANGYVYALYNAGIINGSFVNGINYFYGDKLITRAEVAKIICMINDYIN